MLGELRLSNVTIVTSFEVLPLSDAFFNFDVLPRSGATFQLVAVRVRERRRHNTGVIWVGEAERDCRVTVTLLIVGVNTQRIIYIQLLESLQQTLPPVL